MGPDGSHERAEFRGRAVAEVGVRPARHSHSTVRGGPSNVNPFSSVKYRAAGGGPSRVTSAGSARSTAAVKKTSVVARGGGNSTTAHGNRPTVTGWTVRSPAAKSGRDSRSAQCFDTDRNRSARNRPASGEARTAR